MRLFRRRFLTYSIALVLLSAWAAPVFAQVQVGGLHEVRPDQPEEQARQVRDQFMKVLAKYPPAVAGVLKLDPSLLASDAYVAPYPEIVAFLGKHPEVKRSPAYYFEPVSTGGSSYYYDRGSRTWDDMMTGFFVILVMLTIAGSLGWLVRTAVDYRRWGRLAKVQAEAHTKLLDRFTGNEELLAYVKSPAGMRFLQSAPIALDGSPRSMGSPISRVLWSIQGGVVLTAAGIGMNYVSRHIDPDHSDPIFTLSVIVLSIGLGFLASAALSYWMSQRLGLFVPASRNDVAEG
jgi:hypothetical protein